MVVSFFASVAPVDIAAVCDAAQGSEGVEAIDRVPPRRTERGDAAKPIGIADFCVRTSDTLHLMK